MEDGERLTDLIRLARDGDAEALRRVFAVAYDDLRRMAHARLAHHARGPNLDTTGLVHESFIRFAELNQLRMEDRVHFFRYAGQVMRSVIVDIARAARRERRGGKAVHVPIDTAIGDSLPVGEDEILRVHEALGEIATLDARIVQVVEMRYFAGMSELEIAAALGVTDRTIRRDWEKAKLLLAKALA